MTIIYTVSEYVPRAIYKSSGESVSEARHGGDIDQHLALHTDTSSFVGNSYYREPIADKSDTKMSVISQEKNKFRSKPNETTLHH